MASTYTPAGIELIGDGEQSTTWGDTTNTNWELMEEMVTGVVSIALTATTYTLTTSDGATSNGRHAIVKFTGSPGGTCTVTVSPNDMQKLYYVVNSSDETVTLSQGSGANVSVAAGKNKVVYCDGAGSGAAVVDLSSGFDATTLAELGVTATAAELNTLDGFTGDKDDLNYAESLRATGVTDTEFDYLDGVTSNIQTQLDAKLAIANDLSDLNDAATARTNLGLGALSVLDEVNADTIVNNSVGANELNVAGDGTSGQLLTSDGDGTFSWSDAAAGYDDTELKSDLNATGSAPIYACRAWAYVDDNGSILASGNVASVSKTGTGDYTVTFSTNMSSANYAVVTACDREEYVANVTSMSSSGFVIRIARISTGRSDDEFSFAVFGN